MHVPRLTTRATRRKAVFCEDALVEIQIEKTQSEEKSIQNADAATHLSMQQEKQWNTIVRDAPLFVSDSSETR